MGATRKLKRIVTASLVGLLFFLQLPLFQNDVVQAATEITPLKYYKDKNYRYFVGMMSYEMWGSTDGQGGELVWTDGGRQPNKGMRGDAKFTYKFQFPNRTIKNVEARIYNYPGDPVEYFEESRSDTFEEFRNHISSGTTDADIRPFQKQGVGTNTTTIPITVNMLLDAPEPKNVKDEQCPTCAESTVAYRIYVPILFKIELDTSLTVKYFTEDGKSLASIFPPRQESMVVGQAYDFTPPTNPAFTYVGYKKSTTGSAPGGTIQQGNAPSFTYDASFESYTAYLYYKTACMEPGQGTGTETGPQCPPLPEPEPAEPSVVCTPPQSAAVKTGSLMNSSAVGKIKADARGSEKFEVAKGIPTSESLYGNVWAKEYLYNNKFEKFTGTCTFTVPVSKTYRLKWIEQEERERPDGTSYTVPRNQSKNVEVVKSYDIVRNYSYWTIPGLQVFKIDNAKLYNYAFQGNGIVIEPGSSYNVPTMDVETEVENLLEPSPVSASAPNETINGGSSEPDVPDEDLESYAEEETPELDVRNDKLIFNGETVMDGSIVKTKTKDPGAIKTPLSIDENALYRPGNVIPISKTNKADNESSGTIEYSPLDGSLGNPANERQPVDDLNSVTVHTPVVMYPSVSNDKEHNQKVYPTAGTAALVLDRPFTVTIPTSGQHRDIRGYGNRDYAKYTAYKQVLFEFDVYNEDMGKYIPAKTWIDIPVTQLQTTFRMPVWVDEGKYTVHFRSIAENAPENFTWEKMANFDLSNHVAINTVPVEVIGRLYDFKVTDIMDYDWETVFRTKKGSSEPTGAAYWVGPNSIDGTPRGNKPPFMLPILPGSHPNSGYKNVAIKTGYSFKFDFKTKGNNFGPKDHVKIVPTFYFVDKDGTKRQKVDLYYHNQTTGQKFVKIGSSLDTVTRSMVLNSRMRNIPLTELTNTAEYVATYGFTDFMKQAGKKNTIGSYGLLDLTQRVRTLIGPTSNIPKTVDPGRAAASIQKWYGEV
ncbi:DUF5704 domain-containing protein [Paenibacillus sp. P96]|uniref:DUF5704 domain-containing protein n=1 Tax=Paenibacillus zeirhizosphaerae TaxID=2987519 RepID=A0ABT9FQS8_9BACL|nr:DUF5704 domain-containing protein [Paenibacillus sp. P96]MDP4097067.1 DUF5704 domain-containing protein [Paenibacillus sp. P96]